MLTRSPRRHRTIRGTLLTLVGSLTLASSVLAQSYTYQTIDVPWPLYDSTQIAAITDMGKLAGTFSSTHDLAPGGSWTYLNAQEGFRRLSFKDKMVAIHDMNASVRSVGIYWPTKYGVPSGGVAKPFTIISGRMTTLQLPPLVTVDHCSVNDGHDIVCTGRTAEDVIQAVRVKGSTPGVLQVYPPGVTILGINGTRDVVGTQWDPSAQTYRGYYRQAATGQVTLIDAPCGLDTVIVDVNLASTLAAVQCGHWIAGNIVHESRSYAFNGETWTELTAPGSSETSVHRVNNAGQLVGMYANTHADEDWGAHGFIASPVLGQPIASR